MHILHHCEINNLDPYKVPVFLTLDPNENLYSYVGLSICSSGQLGTLGSSDYYKMFYVAPDSKPEVGEYWRSSARENENIVNEAILRQCMINDTKKETDL